MLGARVAGEILAALTVRPLRTRELTDRVSGCAPRTVYRHASKLARQGLILREEEGDVPLSVTYRLSERGWELWRLLEAHAPGVLSRGSAGGDDRRWPSLALLGDMWASGWMTVLSFGPRSPTELSELTSGMSFHQVNRRVQLLRSRNLLCESAHAGRGKRYRLSEGARRTVALVAGIGRWRERHGVAGRQRGLTGPEAATVLRVALPLAETSAPPGTQIMLGVVGARRADGGRGSEVLQARVEDGATLFWDFESERPADAWAAGTVDVWLAALLDGDRNRMRMGGEVELLETLLNALRVALRQANRRSRRAPPGDAVDP